MNEMHDCFQSEEIQHHGLQIQELSTRSEYKEERLDKLEKKMDDIDKKLDTITESLNELKMQSKTDDGKLEIRLKTIETEIHLMKEQQEKDRNDSQKRLTNYIAIMGLALTALIFIINYLFK